MQREHFIRNLKGTMYYQDTPIVEFEIKNRELVQFEDLSNGKYWFAELGLWGETYVAFNEFFKRRVVQDYAMYLREYLDACGLESYDFEEIVKRNNGSNHLDMFWVKFENIGAKCFNDIWQQEYPIYKEGTV